MGIKRGPADWIKWGGTPDSPVDFIKPGHEKLGFSLFQQMASARKRGDTKLIERLDKEFNNVADWRKGRLYEQFGDSAIELIDKGAESEELSMLMNKGKDIDPITAARIKNYHGAGPQELIERASQLSNDGVVGLNELRLAEEEYSNQMSPIGLGTGVDPRKLSGEWQNGVLEIPSSQGGKGLRINLNNQPYMRKRK